MKTEFEKPAETGFEQMSYDELAALILTDKVSLELERRYIDLHDRLMQFSKETPKQELKITELGPHLQTLFGEIDLSGEDAVSFSMEDKAFGQERVVEFEVVKSRSDIGIIRIYLFAKNFDANIDIVAISSRFSDSAVGAFYNSSIYDPLYDDNNSSISPDFYKAKHLDSAIRDSSLFLKLAVVDEVLSLAEKV